MQTTSSYRQQPFFRLWHRINSRRRKQFSFLLILMVFTSFAEVISISAILPFLAALTAPEQLFTHNAIQPFVQLLEIDEPQQLLLPLTLTFIFAAILAGMMRLLLLWASTRLSFATGADLSIDIYRRTLYQPYVVHCSRNSSEIIAGISTKTNLVISHVIMPFLTLISSSIILIVILLTLLSLNPSVALVTFGCFGLSYMLISKISRKRLLIGSERIANESTKVIKALQEGLGGIRDILINGNQTTYCQIYRNADLPLRRAQGNNYFIGTSPRFGMEVVGMILIALLAYSLAQQNGGVAQAIPTLGVLALGAQKLLPVLQQTYGAWSMIRGSQVSLLDTLNLLEQPLPNYTSQPSISTPLKFSKQIQLRNLSFRYSKETPWIIKNLNLTIPKGSRVGFIGTTGSGKSTLIDIIMGLLTPSEGNFVVDDQVINAENQHSWQQRISHVPQNIFLTDGTIAENIAFGVPKQQVDHQRVRIAAQQAQISNTIESWTEQYQTFVGERGIRLSGGQRQRIGIARALYKQADVIIFDEATSALDSETEKFVMEAIDNLTQELTVIIVAHRVTTLSNCTKIIELHNGNIKSIKSYQEILKEIIPD